MIRTKPSEPKPLPVSTYILISVAGFLISLFCVYYYLNHIQGNVNESVSQKVFYLILILFGIAASALIFGAMNSFGELSGKKLDTKFQFAGPVVGVILIVMGGFYLPKSAEAQTLSIRVVNEDQTPLTEGKVVLYFLHHTREQAVDKNGTAVFSDINESDLTTKLKVDVSSDGYTRLTFDTLLGNFSPLQLTLAQNRTIHITGQVTTADEAPIKDVEIRVDGTPFFGKSASNGTYSIAITDYTLNDEIVLETSHQDYKDKTKKITITKQEMSNIDFVLPPISSPQ